MTIRLIVGLGNPGPEYEQTRHNAGFWLVDNLARGLPGCFLQRESRFNALAAKASIAGKEVWLLEPQTYMNRSGQSVGGLARFFKINPDEVLVVHDELDLPFGRLQLKAGGGAGGHNGLKSMVQCLGEDAFIRVRVGIGKPEGPNAKERVAGYVLSNFDDGERRQLEEIIGKAADMAESWVRDGLSTAMNRHNRRA